MITNTIVQLEWDISLYISVSYYRITGNISVTPITTNNNILLQLEAGFTYTLRVEVIDNNGEVVMVSNQITIIT